MIKKNNFKLIIISIMILGVLLLLLLNGCSLFRQYGSLEGYVYVPDTGNKGAIIIRDSNQVPTGYKPLPGAKVSVQDFYNFVFTDIYGYFLLEDIVAGPVNILIEPPVNSGYNALTTQAIIEPDTTIPIGTYGAVSLPSEGAGYWDISINQIDDSAYPEVKVYVSVIDPGNDIPMIGAISNNFELEINGNKLNTLTVAQAQGETSYPASVSLVIDRSGSMEGENYDDRPLEDAKKAAKTFVNCMGSYDRIEVISFANYVTVDQSFTSDKQALCNAIDSLQSDGATALYDAIWQGLDDTDLEVNSRKAIIALTDGAENCSSNNHGGGDYNFTYSYWSEYPDNSLLINYANSLNIPVYTVGLQGFNFTREKVIRDYSTTEADLKEIAEETGGDYFYAPTSVDLKNIYEEITQRLEQQYIITFTDNTGVTEGYITVKLNYNQLYGEDTKEYNPTTNLAIICIDPSEPGVNQSKQWISILGNNFVEDTEVTFKKGGDTYLIPPERIYFIDSTKIKVFVGLTCTGEWKVHVKNPDGQESEYTFNVSQFKANIIPEKLLDLIDELLLDSPDSYYRDTWKINQNQYKAWIATIAWAEGGMGGFTAHSQGNEGRDYFPHRSLGYDFTFSTGIGPFQIDNGGDYGGTPWEEWSTIDKLDPKKTLEAVMKQHHEQFQGESNLLNFSQNSRYLENSFKWYGVDQDPDGDIESKWETITGSKWKDNNNDRNESLDWENIKERLENDDPNYSYESNVRCLGDRKWNIEAGDIFTNANNPVIFDGDYLTWRITARDEYGIEKFCYYYTYNPYTKIEVWCYGDNSNYKEIFVREYSKGQRPQDPEGDETRGFGFTLEDSALTP